MSGYFCSNPGNWLKKRADGTIIDRARHQYNAHQINNEEKEKLVILKDDIKFQEFCQRNQWLDRVSRGYAERTDVFQFITETYKDWIGKGLVQSDLKSLDLPLYNQMHKKLTAGRQKNSPLVAWFEQQVPKSSSAQGLKMTFPDEAIRSRVAIYREMDRERKAAAKARRGQSHHFEQH